MMSRYASASALTGLTLLGIAFATPAAAEMTGNRYNLPREYNADVSAAKAYLMTSGERFPILKHLRRHRDRMPAPVIIDVRTVQEHLDGHPPGAFSMPFPRVQSKPDKLDFIGYDVSASAEGSEGVKNVGFGAAAPKRGIILQINHFVEYVESVFPDKNRPLYLLCKTGYRSVQAANALVQLGGYNKVYNIWHGYEGKAKYAYDKSTGAPLQPFEMLDLDNDGELKFEEGGKEKIDADDLDGWAYFQGLPVTKRVLPQRIDARFIDLYR